MLSQKCRKSSSLQLTVPLHPLGIEGTRPTWIANLLGTCGETDALLSHRQTLRIDMRESACETQILRSRIPLISYHQQERRVMTDSERGILRDTHQRRSSEIHNQRMRDSEQNGGICGETQRHREGSANNTVSHLCVCGILCITLLHSVSSAVYQWLYISTSSMSLLCLAL